MEFWDCQINFKIKQLENCKNKLVSICGNWSDKEYCVICKIDYL